MKHRLPKRTAAFYFAIAGGCLLPSLLARNAVVLIMILIASLCALAWVRENVRTMPLLVPVFVGSSCVAQVLNLISPVFPVVMAVAALLPMAADLRKP